MHFSDQVVEKHFLVKILLSLWHTISLDQKISVRIYGWKKEVKFWLLTGTHWFCTNGGRQQCLGEMRGWGGKGTNYYYYYYYFQKLCLFPEWKLPMLLFQAAVRTLNSNWLLGLWSHPTASITRQRRWPNSSIFHTGHLWMSSTLMTLMMMLSP